MSFLLFQPTMSSSSASASAPAPAPLSATFVVVGGGIAGVSCAEMLLNITDEEEDKGKDSKERENTYVVQ